MRFLESFGENEDVALILWENLIDTEESFDVFSATEA